MSLANAETKPPKSTEEVFSQFNKMMGKHQKVRLATIAESVKVPLQSDMPTYKEMEEFL